MNPTLGRFVSEDPMQYIYDAKEKTGFTSLLQDPQSLNFYSYARDNPVNLVDPTGEFWDTLWDVANLAYDLVLGTEEDMAFDATAAMIPGLPAGATKVDDAMEFIGKNSDDVAQFTGKIGEDLTNITQDLSGKTSIADSIGYGHAWNVHIVREGQFSGLFNSQKDFSKYIENIMKNPTETKQLQNGRSAYWDSVNQAVVIFDPNNADQGTAFQPGRGKSYFDDLK